MFMRDLCWIKDPVRRHKTAILFVILIPVLLLLFLILYGVNHTSRCYAPTVSALLSDDIVLTIAYAFIVLIYTVLENFVAIEYAYHKRRHASKELGCGFCYSVVTNSKLINRYGKGAEIFMVLRNAMFNLIAVIRVDEYTKPHYAVAALCVIFNQLMFACQIFVRWSTNGKYVWIQGVHWISILAVCTVFAVPAFVDPTWSNNTDWAIWEYMLFFLLACTNIYFVFDVESCCKKAEVACYSEVPDSDDDEISYD